MATTPTTPTSRPAHPAGATAPRTVAPRAPTPAAKPAVQKKGAPALIGQPLASDRGERRAVAADPAELEPREPSHRAKVFSRSAALVRGGIRVRALKMGYYNDIRRRTGDVFLIRSEREFSDLWMRKVKAETPLRQTGPNAAIRAQHDEILANRIAEREMLTGPFPPAIGHDPITGTSQFPDIDHSPGDTENPADINASIDRATGDLSPLGD
jgi:hypothetical protein